MTADSPSKDEGLISLIDYLKGWLPLAWRLPTILRNRKQVANVGTENRESWGSMLEENAAKFPDNPAIKSEEACLSLQGIQRGGKSLCQFFYFKRDEKRRCGLRLSGKSP